MKASTFLAIWMAMLLQACAGPPTLPTSGPTEPLRIVRFACEDGSSMAVAFSGGTARLNIAGSEALLSQLPSGSGIHYAGGGHDLRGKGDELTWTDPGGQRRQCRDTASARAPMPAGPLAGTAWTLVHFQSSDDTQGTLVPPNVSRYTLQFRPDGLLALQLDCNRGSARWSARPGSAWGGQLDISQGAMTRAMCAPGAMDTRIARDLSRIRSYTLTPNGELSLALEADAGIYLWAPLSGMP